jgi:hypothetical protein
MQKNVSDQFNNQNHIDVEKNAETFSVTADELTDYLERIIRTMLETNPLFISS